MERFAEAAEMIKGCAGFAVRDSTITYSQMGVDIFTLHTREGLSLSDYRTICRDIKDWLDIKKILEYFINKPYISTAWRVYNHEELVGTMFIAPGLCIRRRAQVELIWDGEPFTIAGQTAPYSFETAVVALTRYETPIMRMMSEFASVIRDHPDFYIKFNTVFVRDEGRNDDIGRWIIDVDQTFEGLRVKVKDMFNGVNGYWATPEDACDMLRKLMLALNPPLVCSEKILIGTWSIAYPHLMFRNGRIISYGDSIDGKVYSFEDYKK